MEGCAAQEFPPFRLDPVYQCLWGRRETAQDERLLLTPQAFAVLRYLVAALMKWTRPMRIGSDQPQ